MHEIRGRALCLLRSTHHSKQRGWKATHSITPFSRLHQLVRQVLVSYAATPATRGRAGRGRRISFLGPPKVEQYLTQFFFYKKRVFLNHNNILHLVSLLNQDLQMFAVCHMCRSTFFFKKNLYLCLSLSARVLHTTNIYSKQQF